MQREYKKEMNSINAMEELLEYDNDTTLLKFYMHISPEVQLEKLQERIDDPTKNWKHNDADWGEENFGINTWKPMSLL